MKKWVLSRHDSLQTIEGIETSLGVHLNLPRSSHAECEEPEEGVVFVHLDSLVFVQAADKFIPFLGSPETLTLFPSVTVDVGAIKFLLNGADIMRPGIRSFGDWGSAGKDVVVREEQKGRAIAVGQSMFSREEAEKMSKGPCVKNLHHVGDRYWNLYKTV